MAIRKTSWDIAQTAKFTLQLYGKDQYFLASESMQSVWRRLQYARIHYHEAVDLADKFIKDNLTDKLLMQVIYSSEEDDAVDFDDFILRAGAATTAFTQNLHALADTLASALYYSLAMNMAPKPIAPRDINALTVCKRLKADAAFEHIGLLFEEVFKGGGFPHVAALVNNSKHRTLVLTALSEDCTGKRADQHILQLAAFVYEEKTYPAVAVRGFLQEEYDRCQLQVLRVGLELYAVLKSRAEAGRPPQPL